MTRFMHNNHHETIFKSADVFSSFVPYNNH